MPRVSASGAEFPNFPGKRLQPPDDFPRGSPERAFFLETVASVPSDHFQRCDLADLVVYVGAYIDWLTARGELKASGNIIDGKVNPLVALVRDGARTVNILARSLRLTPISRTPQAAKPEPQGMSYYQRQGLLAQEVQRDEQAN